MLHLFLLWKRQGMESRLVCRKRRIPAQPPPVNGAQERLQTARTGATTECRKQKTARYFFNDRTWAINALISSSLNLSLKGFIFSFAPSFKPSLIAANILSSVKP